MQQQKEEAMASTNSNKENVMEGLTPSKDSVKKAPQLDEAEECGQEK